MKLSKVLLGSAIALSLVFGFAACSSDDEDDAFDGDVVNFDNSYIFINDKDSTDIEHAKSATETKTGYTNTANTAEKTKTKSGYYYRAFNLLTTKHYDATCTITLTPNSTKTNDGNVGFVFGKSNETIDETKTYTFGLAAVRYNANNSAKLEYYVSWFKGAVLKGENFQDTSNFMDSNKVAITTTTDEEVFTEATGAKEYEYETTGWLSIDGIAKDADGNISVKVVVFANDDGSYEVVFVKPSVDVKTMDKKTDVLGYGEIPASVTGLTARTQTYIGRYAMIRASEKLNATFEFADISGNPIPADFAE